VPMHFILVDIGISDFRHLHPTEVEPGKFKVILNNLEPRTYISYISFQPLGFAEESRIFNIYPVTQDQGYAAPPLKTLSTDSTVEVSDAYLVNLQGGLNFEVQNFATEANPLIFQVDSVAGETIELEKYLNNFGHLTMINLANYNYVHVHPSVVTQQSAPNQVKFSRPENMEVPAGIYRIFFEFRHAGEVYVATYTLEIKP
ncbi:MAG: hypothetical protein JNK26_00465, partial [Candidatus Doudnabacteria bacterium]|nr:hypothetical protein [Candidatus Doudnabacteria bacterium]